MHESNNGKHIMNWFGAGRDRTTDQASETQAPYSQAKGIPQGPSALEFLLLIVDVTFVPNSVRKYVAYLPYSYHYNWK